MKAPDEAMAEGDYAEWIKSIKERARQARLRALMVANTEQLLLYWDIGDEIRTKQQQFGWGAKIVGQMSRDLRNEFPDMGGWSRSNLMYMRLFAVPWRRDEIVQVQLGQLPWYHQIALMEQLKSRTDRLAYAALAVENGWSRNVLVHHVELGTAKSGGRALTNFGTTLPPLPQLEAKLSAVFVGGKVEGRRGKMNDLGKKCLAFTKLDASAILPSSPIADRTPRVPRCGRARCPYRAAFPYKLRVLHAAVPSAADARQGSAPSPPPFNCIIQPCKNVSLS